MIRRAVMTAALAVGLTVGGPALAASAASAPAVGPVLTKACAPAPEPASPFDGLPGKLYGKPATATDADPFTDRNVKIADVYGYSYHWVNYDNGCLPGSDALPKVQTSVANALMSGSASVSAFTHSLFSVVVTPDFLAPLDGVLTAATSAIKGGLWDPWVTAMLVIVGSGVLIAATRAQVSAAVTTAGWALLVLVTATFVMSYPVSSARAVDQLVQTTIATSARGVGAAEETPGPPGTNRAQAALDDMFDTINRDTCYNEWLDGTVGSSDSAIARTYGPDLFRASHLSWREAETVKDDPSAGQAIIQAKKDLWVKTASSVERDDSGAYQQLTGNNGRWDAAATVVLRVGVTMPFLAVAAVFIVIAYIATRVFVPLAPAFGVLGLLYVTQDWVIGVLKQVGRFVVLGPAFFVAALANLLLDTAVLDSHLAFGLQLVIVAAIPIVLFKLLRPGRAMPGSRAARRMARSGIGTLFNGFVTHKAVRDAVDDGQAKGGNPDLGGPEDLRRKPSTYRIVNAKGAPVAVGDAHEIAMTGAPRRELPTAPAPRELTDAAAAAGTGRYLDRQRELPEGQQPEHALPRRSRRELAIVGGGDALNDQSSAREIAGSAARDAGPMGSRRAASAELDGEHGGTREQLRSHPPIGPEERDVDLAAPVDKNAPRGEVLGHSVELPPGVVEATARYDAAGRPVFEIWRPPTGAHAKADEPEEYL
ncbi:hypothetical protein [Cellulomonas alba]|uniref:TrbL/VirB6 plasmid conjugal transfer protein n=1 Tax=Cellulomonas alba TaxID=3053467 RepID=A0ABT7SIA7_9CELL|nr:hypothetical protein [Cellulomonas alba]MDM7855799.1 hypothetical protein [Cellulomonas alba]